MDAKKRCPNCGCICEADSVFCEECGASLEQTKPPVQNGENSWKNSAPPVTNAGGSKADSGNPKKVGFILLILLLAALLAVLVLLLVWNVGLRKEQTSAGQEALETAQVMTAEASQPALETTAEDTETHFQFAAQTTTAVTTRSAADDAETQTLREAGNGASNIVNGGYAYFDGTYIYWSDSNGIYRVVSNSAEDAVRISAESAYYMNGVGDQLYFVDADRNNAICKMNADGSGFEVVYDMYCYELTYDQDWLYFSRVNGDTHEICRMKPDGSQLAVLKACEEWYMNIYADRIYFCNFDDGLSLCAMNLDGSGLKTLYSGESSDICVAEDTIFFSADRTSRDLYRMNLDGSGVQKIHSGYARFTNYVDGMLCFADEKGTLYYCDTDGSGLQQRAANVTYPVIVDGVLYCEKESGFVESFSLIQ